MRQQLRLLTCLTIVGLSASAHAQEQVALDKPNIERFINHIWDFSPTIAESEARVLAAEAGQRAASKWRHNPEIEFGLEDVDGEDKTKTLGISQTIDWSGKFLSSGQAASFELQAVEAERDGVRQDTALNVLSSLADYRAAKDIYNLAVERSGLMERFATLAQKGFKAGDIDQSEKNLAQLALSEALIVQADAENELGETKQALDSSVGFPLENGFSLPELPGSLPELPETLDEEQILMALPSLRAMRSREAAAKAVITGAWKNRLPDPTIGITGGQDTGADMIGFSVSVPLNIFNTYGAEVDRAKADALAEAKAGQNAFYSARTRIKAAKRSYQLSRKAWENWQGNGAQALAEQADILDRKFKVGDLSATDYLVQIEQALDTQVAAEELHAKVWRSWFSWLAASGKTEQWIQNSGE